ncbi:MAG: ATP-binding cassette domain-containing protein [Acholeplasmatales bacterium]|jgi:ATPase subunit of ABC transporter with duplicated ATPase domains|nr:ATP-binding cassette domain-containing protein [Acholeplasmatales bacterium]
MGIIELKDITFNYQNELLLKDVNLELFYGDHACLIGSNGSGKTTLFNLIIHNLTPDKGQVNIVNNLKIGYLDQHTNIDKHLTGYQYLYGVYQELFEQEKRMNDLYASIEFCATDQHELILIKAQKIMDILNDADFFELKSAIERTAIGLGLSQDILAMSIGEYSGGMRSKLILTKLLLDKSDLLLLDEPTNFLDIKHIEWLVTFLNEYKGSFLVISHDTSFVNDIAKIIFSLENYNITKYRGNYDFYLTEREIRNTRYLKEFKNQQILIQKSERFIQRFHAKASLASRAQSRKKALEKLNKLPPPAKELVVRFDFKNSLPSGRDVLVTNNLTIGWDEPLIEDITINIIKESFIVIIGKNGVGKSTFLKTILNKIPALSGSFKWNVSAIINYFEQDNNLDVEATPFYLAQNIYPDKTIPEVRNMLASFGINYDHQNRALKLLSGGEITKLRLCLLSKNESNVFILDEPTNHLDVNAKRALKSALLNYKGTVILVSHDQDFYNDLASTELKFE